MNVLLLKNLINHLKLTLQRMSNKEEHACENV